MSNKPEVSNSTEISKFLFHLEKGLQSIIDDSFANHFGSDKELAKSHLKRPVRLLVHTHLDNMVNKLIP